MIVPIFICYVFCGFAAFFMLVRTPAPASVDWPVALIALLLYGRIVAMTVGRLSPARGLLQVGIAGIVAVPLFPVFIATIWVTMDFLGVESVGSKARNASVNSNMSLVRTALH